MGATLIVNDPELAPVDSPAGTLIIIKFFSRNLALLFSDILMGKNKIQKFPKEEKLSAMGIPSNLESFLHEPISKPVMVVLYCTLLWRSGFFLVLEK